MAPLLDHQARFHEVSVARSHLGQARMRLPILGPKRTRSVRSFRERVQAPTKEASTPGMRSSDVCYIRLIRLA